MPAENPFQSRFQTLGHTPVRHAERVNQEASRALQAELTVRADHPGRCILLRAPRAGYGKTHLLARIQHLMGATHEFIAIHPREGFQVDAATLTDDVLRRLSRALPGAGGMCVLDLVARRMFAMALLPLVGSGEVPCQDREGALAALQIRPIETFDFHHPNAVTAHWTRDNFAVLGPRLSLEIAQGTGLPAGDVAFWVDLFFRFASQPLEHPTRLHAMIEAVRATMADGASGFTRLSALLSILSRLTRVVLVADEMEGFSADGTAALRLASFIGNLRQAVDRMDVILSVNRDVWESAFVPRLSCGLADRLAEVVIELEPMNEAAIADLLEARAPGMSGRLLETWSGKVVPDHARALIQAAGGVWAEILDSKPFETDGSMKPSPVVVPSESPMDTPEPVSPPPNPTGMMEPEDEFAFAPAQPSAVGEASAIHQAQPVEAGAPQDGRVDELLRQFRERYGRA